MATVREHIKQLFSGFKLPLNDAALEEIATHGVVLESTYGGDNHADAMKAILLFAPLLLLSPASYTISEGGLSESVTWNKDGFLKWYSLMCKRYGVKDELNTERPKIKFL